MTKRIVPTLITSISKDELLPFYFVRVAERAYHNCHPQTWYAPSRLDSILESFLGTSGAFAQMEPFNTFLPLQSRFLTPDDVGVVRTHGAKKPVHGIMAILGMNGPNGGWAKTIPSFCPECIKEDIALCGTPFWNRANLVPGLLVCSRHETPLMSAACDMCIDRALQPNRNSRPGLHCGCGIAPLPGSTNLSNSRQIQELEIHRIAGKLLDPSYLPELTRDTLARAIQIKSEDIRLAHGTALNPRRAREFFNEHPWRPLFERVKILAQVQSEPGYLTGKLVFRNPLQSIALAYGLFGNWFSLKNAIRNLKHRHHDEELIGPLASTTHSKKLLHKKRFIPVNINELLIKYSEKYSKIRNGDKTMTHTQITKIIGNHAGGYVLTKELLHQAGIDVPFYKLTDESYRQIDIDLAEIIFDKHDELVIRNNSGKINAHALLQDFGFRKYILLHKHIPFSVAALKLCTTPNQAPAPLSAERRVTSLKSKRRSTADANASVLIDSLVQFSPPSQEIIKSVSPNRGDAS